MDRAQLKHLLTSGPSLKLDVRRLSQSGLPPLFRTTLLNNTILFKQAVAHTQQDDGSELPPIATLIYIPYNRSRPEEGGESFYYASGHLTTTLQHYLGEQGTNPDAIIADTDLLTALDSIPTFSPFLMRDVLERANIDVPDGYFVIADKEAASIKQRMRARLRPLVAVACSGDNRKVSQTSIERLVQTLWNLNDIDELMPVIQAFRLDPDDAPQIFYCWLGIAFFESEYLRLQERLKRLATWIAQSSKPKEILPRELLDHYNHLVVSVRKLLQGHWKKSLGILREYTTTYDGFISAKTSAAPFIAFLRESTTHFWALGGALGRLEQSVETWELICGRIGYGRMNYDQGNDLFGTLCQINAVTLDDEVAGLSLRRAV